MMMARIKAVLGFAVAEFAPLIGFLLLSQVFGTKVAIAGTLVIVAIDSGWRWCKRVPFTRTYLLFVALTLVFGTIDLLSATPFMLKYEAVISNGVTGAVFVLGALGPKPLIQQVAEQREGRPFTRDATRIFFRWFTLAWSAYFFLKAAFYFWAAWTMPMAQAVAIRSVVGSLSLGLMLLVSYTQGRRLFFLCQRWGLLPPSPMSDGEAPQSGSEDTASEP
jgi:intracellular septation protein A